MQPIKKLPLILLLAFILLNFLFIYLSALVFLSPFIVNLQKNTHGWVDPNIISFSLLNISLVLGLLVIAGKLTAKDLGLINIRLGIYSFAGIWIFSQLIAAIVSFVTGEGIAIHPVWGNNPNGYIFGFLIAMVLGTALYEEIAFRGVIFPQLFFILSFPGISYRLRLFLAILISAGLFSLFHTPSLILIRQLSFNEILLSLLGFLIPGFILCLAYLRTGTLYIPIAIHALNNAPTPMLYSQLNSSLTIQLAGLLLIILWPLWQGKSFGYLYTLNPAISTYENPTSMQKLMNYENVSNNRNNPDHLDDSGNSGIGMQLH